MLIVAGVRKGIKSLVPEALARRTLTAPVGQRILLTFDDGPSPDVTPAVLDRLEQYHARAVFFVVGKFAERTPDLLRAMLDRGHVVGNHTYQHRNDRDPWFVPYLRDLRRCQAVVAAHAPVPRLFRPPKGHLTATAIAASRLAGMRLMHWSLSVGDWNCKTAAEAHAAAVALDRSVAPGQILLLHDNNQRVLDVLDYILPRLAERGFDMHSAIDEFRAG